MREILGGCSVFLAGAPEERDTGWVLGLPSRGT